VSKFVGEGFHALPFPICVVGDADRHRDLSLQPIPIYGFSVGTLNQNLYRFNSIHIIWITISTQNMACTLDLSALSSSYPHILEKFYG
ncbi:MAG: hypothetical protein IJT23_00670, partial [Clostridia bacterium]|nr:hypothetical protein [Clostridia bacterium]